MKVPALFIVSLVHVPTSSAFRFIFVSNSLSVLSIGFAVASTRICIIYKVK